MAGEEEADRSLPPPETIIMIRVRGLAPPLDHPLSRSAGRQCSTNTTMSSATPPSILSFERRERVKGEGERRERYVRGRRALP